MEIKYRNKDNLNIIFKLLALFFFYLVQQLPVVLLQTAAIRKLQTNNITHLFISLGFIGLSILAVGSLIITHKKTQTFKTQPLTKKSWAWIGIGFLATIAANSITLMFVNSNNSNQNVDSLNQLSETFPMLFVIFAIFIAPISEEILFRSFVVNWFFKDHLYLGIFISALAFGLLHISTDFFYFLSKFLLGLILGLVYIKTKNLKANIIVHLSNNLLASIGMIFVILKLLTSS